MPHHFISYSSVDAPDFALRLADSLQAGPPEIPVWLDQRALQPGPAWDEQLVEAIRTCDGVIFVMTRDSVNPNSVCKQEWTRALKYKKPIIPIKLHDDAEMPFRLEPRHYIDFTGSFETGLARLRERLRWQGSPAGQLQAMQDRLDDAKRDLVREKDPTQRTRIQDDIELLQKQIAVQREVVADPQAAAQRVSESIARGLERERQPERPSGATITSKFINPPPGLAPGYFQDRVFETVSVGAFLNDEALRLLTVVGRGGTGKTALVCRLLKSLESGQLPDNGGAMRVEGIVYLSATGTRRVNVPNLYSDLGKLLPTDVANQLDALYKNPQVSTAYKMQTLLANFPQGRTVLLLDNFEDLIDPSTLDIHDGELDEALRALLDVPQHGVKVIITTRIPPRTLALVQPGRQRRLDLDEGLVSPYAENILREMDADGKVGLKSAPDKLLNEARERTRGYPRALEALFAILSADRDTTLPELLSDTAHMLPDNVVRDLVGEAFSRLDPAAQQVMQALAVYNRPVTPAAVDYLLQPYMPSVNSAPVLNRLVNMQFARKETGRYYLHPVDRAYAFTRIPAGEQSDRRKVKAAPFTQFSLLHRAAEYFKKSRIPREDWKTIEDLAPQLAEFDLRCEGQDYETAAWVLLDIDFDYLLRWGFYRLVIELHERLQDKLNDPSPMQRSAGNLGSAYRLAGRVQEAIDSYEQALTIARGRKDRGGEGAWLGGLGNCYVNLGQTKRAIKCYEQSIAIFREINELAAEGSALGNLGNCYAALGQTDCAIEYYEKSIDIPRIAGRRLGQGHVHENLARVLNDKGNYQEAIQHAYESIKIGDELSSPTLGSIGNEILALLLLYTGNLSGARAAAESARQYDEPENNHNASVAFGVIAVRQDDRMAAQEAFATAVAQADALLTHSAQYFNALDAKGVALCGLTLCEGGYRVPEAIESFKAARVINKDDGYVKRLLKLFDALAVADEAGLLTVVRAAAAGEMS
ncbi:MAG TPA: tetratricopeptide repeat protein [Pyrinomonadaceae bacterium]|nr:tetratricopeptide repeat protein [Pyrinomonadaceae bacterium]